MTLLEVVIAMAVFAVGVAAVLRIFVGATQVWPSLGGQSKAGKGVKKVQDVLGDHQDTVVAEEWLRATLPGVEVGEAFAMGQLVAGERARRAELRAAWSEQWEKASADDRWAWLP